MLFPKSKSFWNIQGKDLEMLSAYIVITMKYSNNLFHLKTNLTPYG